MVAEEADEAEARGAWAATVAAGAAAALPPRGRRKRDATTAAAGDAASGTGGPRGGGAGADSSGSAEAAAPPAPPLAEAGADEGEGREGHGSEGAAGGAAQELGAWAMADAPVRHEYLDHTADVQLHSWGGSLAAALEQQVLAIFGLITELEAVECDLSAGAECVDVEAQGHDLHSLLYNFLDEWLFQFNGELFVCRRVAVTSLDTQRWRVTSRGVGERFRLGKHPQGTEVKAVTYSAMRVTQTEERTDILVIVDI